MEITTAIYEDLGNSAKDWREIFRSRLAFWPVLFVEKSGSQKNWFVAKPNTYAPGSSHNFWLLSKQYYALAWSLFTLGHPNQILMPYRDNLSSPEDKAHQLELKNIISDHGWGFVHFLGLAHLSCELGFKSILLHSCVELGMVPGFPRTHDLEELFNLLRQSTIDDIRNEFKLWSTTHSPTVLDDVLHKSGERFLLQRYGDLPAANPKQLGVIDLSRFLHTYIN